MADFVSEFWHWFIVIPTLVGLLALFPLVILNKGSKPSGDPETMGHVWDEDLEEYNNPLPRWWLNMFYITLVWGLLYLVFYPGLGTYAGILGWASKTQYEGEISAAEQAFGPLYKKYSEISIPELAKNAEAMKTGERLFANYCTTCHGSDARGARGFPNLRDADWLYGADPAQIEASISNGRRGAMPGWEAALGEDGVDKVTEFILSLSRSEGIDLVAASIGREHYNKMCIACHGPDGSGNKALGGANLADKVWLYGGSRKAVRQTIAKGRQGNMPPHLNFLGKYKVHLLAAYVYGLSADRRP